MQLSTKALERLVELVARAPQDDQTREILAAAQTDLKGRRSNYNRAAVEEFLRTKGAHQLKPGYAYGVGSGIDPKKAANAVTLEDLGLA